MKKGIGISSKLVLLVCFCVGLGLAGAAFISLDLLKSDSLHRAQESDRELAELISGEINEQLRVDLEKTQSMAQIVIDSLVARPGAILPTDAQNKITALLASEDSLISFGVFRPSGKDAFTELYFSGKAETLAEFELSANTLKTAPMAVITKDVAAHPDKLISINTAPALKKAVVSIVSTRKVTGQKDHWLIRTDLRQDAFLRYLMKRPSLTSYIIDQKGNVIVHPDFQLVMHPTSIAGTGIFDAMSDDNNKALGLGSAEFVGEKGKALVGAFKTLNVGELSVIVQGERSRTAGSLHRLKYRLMLAGIIALCFGFIVAFLFSNSLVSPLKALFQTTEKIIGGHFDSAPEIGSHDEIGVLAFNFRKMNSQLQDRERLKNTLSKLPTAEMTDKVLSGEIKLPTERKTGTVMFCSLRDVADFGENLRPDEIIRQLSDFQNEVIKAVQKNQGVVDKASGHSVKAVWGGLTPSSDGGFAALLASLEIRKAIKAVNHRRETKGLPEIGFNIGIHTGEMIAGHIGLDNRTEYMFVGDAVDKANQTELACRMLRSDIAISEQTFSAIKNRTVIYGHPTPVEVAGIREPITVYQVIGRKKSDGVTESDLSRSEQEAIVTGIYHPSNNTHSGIVSRPPQVASQTSSMPRNDVTFERNPEEPSRILLSDPGEAPASGGTSSGTGTGTGYRFDLTGVGMTRPESSAPKTQPSQARREDTRTEHLQPQMQPRTETNFSQQPPPVQVVYAPAPAPVPVPVQAPQPVQMVSPFNPSTVQMPAPVFNQAMPHTQVTQMYNTQTGHRPPLQVEPQWYLMRDPQNGMTEGPLTLSDLREVTHQPGFYFEQAYAYRLGDSYMTPIMQVPGLSRRNGRPPQQMEAVPPLPPHIQAQARQEEWYVYGQDGGTFGPYSLQQLGQALDAGQITRTTYCWHQGMPQWVFAYQVPGLDRRQNGPPAPPIPIGRVA